MPAPFPRPRGAATISAVNFRGQTIFFITGLAKDGYVSLFTFTAGGEDPLAEREKKNNASH